MALGIQAKQITTNGSITTKRALFKELLVYHPISGDSIYKVYDLAAAPTGGEPYYTFEVYGKGQQEFDISEPGVLFKNGIYVEVVAGTTVTVLYEEV